MKEVNASSYLEVSALQQINIRTILDEALGAVFAEATQQKSSACLVM
jgi:hypothetical protein